MAAAAFLKNRKIAILGDSLIDVHEIWHGTDVVWPSWAFRPLKFQLASARPISFKLNSDNPRYT